VITAHWLIAHGKAINCWGVPKPDCTTAWTTALSLTHTPNPI